MIDDFLCIHPTRIIAVMMRVPLVTVLRSAWHAAATSLYLRARRGPALGGALYKWLCAYSRMYIWRGGSLLAPRERDLSDHCVVRACTADAFGEGRSGDALKSAASVPSDPPLILQVRQRVANATGVPITHSEHPQVHTDRWRLAILALGFSFSSARTDRRRL